jgi:magnesium chelatase subunit D
MKPSAYPFAAIVEQNEMKLALLLAAVDWRLGVLLRGEKGSGKTTCARGLAALLPAPAPFINLPIGATEDRLLGGLHLERALKGEPVLKPGLLSEAHGGVLYVDEVNLLAGHLGDALLDTAASGINVVEREGLSASHPAEFLLLGSMNPEEGSLRPQLLDRFALSVTVTASIDPVERQTVVERRIAFDRAPSSFLEEWSSSQQTLKDQIVKARSVLINVACSGEMLAQISSVVCEKGVRSLRADLAVMRAATACAALAGDESVESRHIDTVLPLVLAHRIREGSRSKPPQATPPLPQQSPTRDTPPESMAQETMERIFATRPVGTPAIHSTFAEQQLRGDSSSTPTSCAGPIIGARQSDSPTELDLRTTLNHAVLETGTLQPRVSDLHERVRRPRAGTRYLVVIDSSGSHAVQERMRLVKGATSGMLTRSFKRGDEAAIIVFRGTSAQVLLEPTETLADALTALEYLPTGGRTPLAHALSLAKSYITPSTILILLTDGRANIPLGGGDPSLEALEIASQLSCRGYVIDTENPDQRLGNSQKLAEALGAHYTALEDLEKIEDIAIDVERLAGSFPKM